MADFVWEARARTGELRKGQMEADNEDAVQTRLRAQQLVPTKVKKKGKEFKLQFGTGVGQKDIVTFTRLFATMIDAGLPIVQCLDILATQTDNPRFAVVLRDVKATVEQGATFSEALRRHPKIFDTLFSNLVQAGEIGGILDTILNRLAVYIEKNMKLKRQLRGAMVYPSSVLIVFVAVLGVLLGFVIPSFKEMFKEFGSKTELPGITKFVIFCSEFFIHNILYVIALGIGAGIGISQFYKTPNGKRFIHKMMLKTPIMGRRCGRSPSPASRARSARCCRPAFRSWTRSTSSRRPPGTSSSKRGSCSPERASRKGRTWPSRCCRRASSPRWSCRWSASASRRARSIRCSTRLPTSTKKRSTSPSPALTSLIEPVMMVGIGGTVGVVLIAMYMPIFSLAGAIKGD